MTHPNKARFCLTSLALFSIVVADARECTPEEQDIPACLRRHSYNWDINYGRLSMTASERIVGRKFGRLLVLGRDTSQRTRKPSGPLRKAKYVCVCDCGKIHMADSYRLQSGETKSCGCLRRETLRTMRLVHGMKNSPEHRSWSAMKNRCNNPMATSYHNYGARGIAVCDRWNDSFVRFLEDMGERPDGTSLDRIDNDGDYCPENCRWATRAEQSRNTRQNRMIRHNGVVKCATDWAAGCGVALETLRWRIDAGWDIENALTDPPHALTDKRRTRWAR